MPDRYRRARVTLTSLLKALAAAGVPGASLAADAVDQAAQVLDARRAWDEAADALARAEEAFREEAAGRGWADLADALTQLPVHNLPAFEAALRAALGAGDPQALQAALRDQLAVLPGVDDPALAAQAARLYAAHVLDALWQVDALRGAVRDVLFKGQVHALRRLEDAVDALRVDLPRLSEAIAAQVAAALQPHLDALPQATAHQVVAALEARHLVARPSADPARMLRILAVLAAPVAPPREAPDQPPPAPLDLPAEWARLRRAVEATRAPMYLRRLFPPTLDALRRALSPRARKQGLFPHILHFSGHAAAEGLLLEDETGRGDFVPIPRLREALALDQPLDLVVLNACETAAHAQAVAQMLVNEGLARAVVAHPKPVRDDEAVAFARTLYTDLTDGYTLAQAVERAAWHLSTHEPVLLGEADLRFTEHLARGEALIEDGLPRHNLRPSRTAALVLTPFFGRGKELVRIAEALAQTPTVVVLSGGPGLGKSRLALEAAHRNAWRFPGGVVWAEAAQGVTEEALLTALAAALGLEYDPRETPAAPVLLAYAASNPTLFVLDNLEALDEAALNRLWTDFLERLAGESAALLTLRPPLPARPRMVALRLTRGLEPADAARLAQALAARHGVNLPADAARDLAAATHGHPQLLTLLVARFQDRDFHALLDEVRGHEGDFAAQVEALYAWSAARVDQAGRRAWATLALWPAPRLPEAVARGLWGREGMDALRGAAVAAFDPHDQVWAWHATAAEYAARRWPLEEAEAGRLLAASLPGWTAWLNALAEQTEPARDAALAAQEANLRRALEALDTAPWPTVQAFGEALAAALPLPDHTLRLRAFQAGFYRRLAEAARAAGDTETFAWARGMEGYALSALGRHEEALQATKEAVALYRDLAQRHPDRFLPDLAMSLNNLGNIFSALGRPEEALQATQEGVALYRDLAQRHPDRFLPELARSLGARGWALLQAGRSGEAAEALAQGLHTLLPLARRLPRAFGPLLQILLQLYGMACRAAGREPDADLVREAQAILGGAASASE